MYKRNTVMVATEAIDHQDNKFVNQLTDIFQRAKDFGQEKGFHLESTDYTKFEKEFEQAVKARLGFMVKFKFECNTALNAYAIPAPLKETNILDEDSIERTRATLMQHWRINDPHFNKTVKDLASGKLGDPTGYLNYKKAKASGVFSRYTIEVCCFTGTIEQCSAYEVASIMLHELGHVWTFFEFLGVSMFRNAIISNVTKEFLNTKGEEEKFVFLFNANQAFKLEIDEDILKDTSKLKDEDAVKVLIGSLDTKYVHDQSFIQYNFNTSEVIADQFAIRFGGQLPEVWAQNEGRASMFNNTFLFWMGVSVAGFVTAVLTMAAAPIVAIIGHFIGMCSVSQALGIFASIPMLNGWTYDVGIERIIRMRNEMVNRLAKANLSKEDKAKLLAQVEKFTEYCKKNAPKDFLMEKIYAFFSSDYRDQKQKRLFQQTLEELLANDLFVSAAKMKQY